MGGGVGWLCQNIFMDLKKCWKGYAKIFYGGLKNVWGVCQQILCMDLKKKIGGGVVMPKYFIDLKKCWGGVCGRIPKHFWDLKKMLVGGGGGVMPKYFTDLKKCWGGVCQQIYGLEKC